MKAPLKVPVRIDKDTGIEKGIMHDTDYARGASTRDELAAINAEQRATVGHHRWGAEYVMEEFEPFTDLLRFVSYYHHRSSAYLTFEDTKGRTFPVFLTDLPDILGGADMLNGWLVPAKYEACKRGARSYGIRKVKENA